MRSTCFTILLLLIIASSCNKTTDLLTVKEQEQVDENEMITEDKETNEDYIFDCTFIQDASTADSWFNDFESSAIKQCGANQYKSIESIKQNIIGEWELIGHAVGRAAPISKPCAHININKEELVFTFINETVDTVINCNWEIIEDERFGEKVFRLKVKPSFNALNMHSFCAEYMFEDNTPVDGFMYLYQKMK